MTLCVLYIDIRVSTVHMLSSSPYRSGERAQLVHYVPSGQVVACVGFGPNHEEMESFATEEGAWHCAKHIDTSINGQNYPVLTNCPNDLLVTIVTGLSVDEWITYVYLKMRSHMPHVRGEPWQPCLQAWVNYP